jgi:hypothetical protein
MPINAHELRNGDWPDAHVRIGDDEGWAPARPYCGAFYGERIREAWKVLCGKRHTVVFPGQEPEDTTP